LKKNPRSLDQKEICGSGAWARPLDAILIIVESQIDKHNYYARMCKLRHYGQVWQQPFKCHIDSVNCNMTYDGEATQEEVMTHIYVDPVYLQNLLDTFVSKLMNSFSDNQVVIS